MSDRDYTKEILERLLKKYHRRTGTKIKRRICLKPTELYKRYGDNNADITEKQKLAEGAERLSGLEYIFVERLKFSEDIEKIYLCEEKLDEIMWYMEANYGVKPYQTIRERAEELMAEYGYPDIPDSNPDDSSDIARRPVSLVPAYCARIEKLLDSISSSAAPGETVGLERLEANLKILSFIAHNEEPLYLRELSMLVYGDSKWFEDNNCDEICTFIREARGCPREEDERNDAVLAGYHIFPPDQEIFLKGGWLLEWPDGTLDLRARKGGIAVSTRDIPSIRRVILTAPCLLTVENKTAYQRMESDRFSFMYLGGYASSGQIAFLRKVIRDNPEASLAHFGDIDVGGFLIHRHLCRMTGSEFELYQMGIEQLEDKRYRKCLKKLTENDRVRMKGLMEEEPYRRVLGYMAEHDVKLEQEIISYYISVQLSETNGVV